MDAGQFDVTFDECSALSDRMCGNMVRLPERTLESIGSFEVCPKNVGRLVHVRGQHFYKVDEKGEKHLMLHVVIESTEELDRLRRTGRFREWDADLREPKG